MSKDEKNNINNENETTSGPAPPIKPKKHIRYKIIRGSFKNSNIHLSQNSIIKHNNILKESKIDDKLTSIPSNDDWSIFSPNFFEKNSKNDEENFTQNAYYYKNKTINEEKFHKKLSRSMINKSHQDDDKIIKLEKEINGLKETNQNILNLIMEKEKENRSLINIIDNYRAESIEKLSNYLNYIEDLGKKFKFSNDDEDENINIDANNNSPQQERPS